MTWTPAPWKANISQNDDWWFVEHEGSWVAQTESCFPPEVEAANRDLIALAPEMAAVILALSLDEDHLAAYHLLDLHALADKLKAIQKGDT